MVRSSSAAAAACGARHASARAVKRVLRMRRGSGMFQVRALDAAMPFDYEAREAARIRVNSQLTVGIVGFGNFGQFLAKRMVSQGHRVLATSRGDYGSTAKAIGVSFFGDSNDFCEEHPDVVLLCTSILSLEKVLDALPMQRLKRNTLVVDVLSVKDYPRILMLQKLPPDFDIICTHPMFGPESGKGSWEGLPFVYDKVRLSETPSRTTRAKAFLSIFEQEGCRMVEMSCLEHDRLAAGTQFVTHAVGRMLGRMHMPDTPINTKGYESLLTLVENTNSDSFELFYGLFMYNNNATDELERLELAFDDVKKELLGRMHKLARKQLFGSVATDATDADGAMHPLSADSQGDSSSE